MLSAACDARPTSLTGGTGAAQNAPRTEKVLTWAIQQEPTDVTALSGLGGTRGPASAFAMIAHHRLVRDDHTATPFPDLARELPSAEKGTWRVNPDGTMETVWKLRPNVKWHDGVPFTVEDVVFWLRVLKDDSIPAVSLIGLDQIVGMSAPDPATVVLSWSQPHYRADRLPEFGPLPRHLLEGVFVQRDFEALLNHRYFTTEFVGLGPYRLTGWEPGARIEFARFDEYFRGRPTLDRVVLRIIPDFNTMVSNALAGTVDVAKPPADNMDVAMDLQRRWAGTGNRVRTDPNERIRLILLQYRPEYARPPGALASRSVRQALYHAIDRAALAQVAMEGLAPVADSWFAPAHSLRKQIEASIPQFPYDVARAEQLLAEAGWVRGPDGTVARADTGERFEIEVRYRPGSATERETVIVADYWKAARVGAVVAPGSPTRVVDREWLATFPGAELSRLESEDAFNTRRTHSRAIAAPANRWAGRNNGGYSNPTADALQDRLVVTVDPAQQLTLHRQLLQEMMGEVAFMPLFWDVEVALVSRTVKGEVTAVEMGWNLFQWNKE
jgi:peptide/nickel transport system substrate-binding protein